MKATIIATIFGVLGFGEDNKLVEKTLFPRDASKIAENLSEIESGKIISEVAFLVRKLQKKGYTVFVFENAELSQSTREEMGIKVEVEVPSKIGEKLRENLGEYAVEVGFVGTPTEISGWLHDISMAMSRGKVRKATEKKDLLIVQAVQALDDMDKTLNLFMERIQEWYGLHFPELNRLLEKHETYAKLVSHLGKKENFTEENLKKEGLLTNKEVQLVKVAKASMGADFNDNDMLQIQKMCEQVLALYNARFNLEKYIEESMREAAPNTTVLTGATLGAKLISLAGSLDNLAKMPASTIQVLGAEKALFRSLTSGASPPKHGIIFQHTLIHGTKRWLRGKIARAFAGKLAIAVRTDAFSGNYIGDKIKENLQKRVEEIEKKYVEPKPKPKHFEEKRRRLKDRFRESQRRRMRHGH